MNTNKHTEWFESWFDSPYYPLLYTNRSESEAAEFISILLDRLNLKNGSTLLDVGCGRGRHSILFNKKGFNVSGIDLSANSIAEAKKHEGKELEFFVHDMRNPFRINYYDVVVNLFTSFGYFKNPHDNSKALKAMYLNLKPGGALILDYLNTSGLCKRSNFPMEETKTVNNIIFNTKKNISGDFITKCIEVNDHGKKSNYQEQVRLIHLNDFKKLFSECNLEIVATFGDYKLNNYNEDRSERLIIQAVKK